MAGALTRDQLVSKLTELKGFKEKVANTWQQLTGQIELIEQLLVEMDKEQQAAS